ncbi:MAG: peptidoglycan-associated lipoprotein Pal [Syntrophales bacterium]
MMRRKQLWMGLAVMVLFLTVAFVAGCTKKAALKNETMAHREQKQVLQSLAKAKTDDKATKESILREQELREQTLRDQAARGKSPESARREAVETEGAMLKELQIPDIHFDFDEYTLKPENQAILKAGARAYLKDTQYKLLIEGHCDERGTVEYNLALGQKRADEAAKYLIDLGIAKERITTISYGKERPLDPGHDETALAKNRRDHFVVSQPVK